MEDYIKILGIVDFKKIEYVFAHHLSVQLLNNLGKKRTIEKQIFSEIYITRYTYGVQKYRKEIRMQVRCTLSHGT